MLNSDQLLLDANGQEEKSNQDTSRSSSPANSSMNSKKRKYDENTATPSEENSSLNGADTVNLNESNRLTPSNGDFVGIKIDSNGDDQLNGTTCSSSSNVGDTSNDNSNQKNGNVSANKRTHYASNGHLNGGKTTNDNSEVCFKVLIPSSAAGSVIGRGGERIAQIQKDTCVKMKMSKANDYYPNTNERVCLIIGTIKSVLQAHDQIVERIMEKANSSLESNGMNNYNGSNNNTSNNGCDDDRSNQIKILIPNSTAGLLIGKGGAYIKQIKDSSGAFVQISSKQTDLPERVVTIDGDSEKRSKALQLVIRKIAEDPQHNCVTNLSYTSFTMNNNNNSNNSNNSCMVNNSTNSNNNNNHNNNMGNCNNFNGLNGNHMMSNGIQGNTNMMNNLNHHSMENLNHNSQFTNGSMGNMLNGCNGHANQHHLHHNGLNGSSNLMMSPSSSSPSSSQNKFDFNSAAYVLAGLNNLSMLIINCGGSFQMSAESLKMALRNAGFSSSCSIEIIDAIKVLMAYGLITKVPPNTINNGGNMNSMNMNGNFSNGFGHQGNYFGNGYNFGATMGGGLSSSVAPNQNGMLNGHSFGSSTHNGNCSVNGSTNNANNNVNHNHMSSSSSTSSSSSSTSHNSNNSTSTNSTHHSLNSNINGSTTSSTLAGVTNLNGNGNMFSMFPNGNGNHYNSNGAMANSVSTANGNGTATMTNGKIKSYF